MKIKSFPNNHYYQNFIILNDKVLFFIKNNVVAGAVHKRNRQHQGMLYDPIEDKIFGHICCHKVMDHDLESIGKVFYNNDYNEEDFYIGIEKEHPIFVSTKLTHVVKDKPENDSIYYRVAFDLLNNNWFLLNLSNIGERRFLNHKSFSYYYEPNLFIYCNGNYYSNGTSFPLETIHDMDILKQIISESYLEFDSYVSIVQPKIHSEPKTLDVGFNIINIIKYPHEPMVIVNGISQYAIIDLDY